MRWHLRAPSSYSNDTREHLRMAQPTILTLSQEVLLRICYWIIPPPRFDASEEFQAMPRALVALALSCRTLSEAALDVLWYALESPWPLLYTLPRDLCVFVTIEEGLYGYKERKAVRDIMG